MYRITDAVTNGTKVEPRTRFYNLCTLLRSQLNFCLSKAHQKVFHKIVFHNIAKGITH